VSNEEIQIKIRAIAEGIDAANAQLKELGGSLGAIPPAAGGAGAGAEQLGGKMTSLHEILGSSRRETMFLEQSLVSITGVSGPAARGFEAVMTGLGPIGIAATLAAGGLETFKTLEDQSRKVTDDLAKSLVTMHEEQVKAAGTGFNFWPSDENKKAIADYDTKIKEVGKTLAELKGQFAAELRVNPSGSADLDMFGGKIKEVSAELDNLIKLRDELSGKDYVSPEQINGFREANAELGNIDTTLVAVAYDADAAFKRMEAGANAAGAAIKATGGAVREEGGLADIGPAGADQIAFTDLYVKGSDIRTAVAKQETAAAKAEYDKRVAQDQAYYSKLEGMAGGLITVSGIDAPDVRRQQLQKQIAGGLSGDALTKAQAELTSLGSYVEKYDENIRRLRAIDNAGNLTQGDLPSLLAKMPENIQAQLKTAFASGGSAGLKLTAKDLIASGENFSNPDMWDVTKLSADLKAKVQKEKDLVKLEDLVIAGAGLDKNDAMVASQAKKITGQDELGVGGMITGAQTQLSKFDPSASLLAGIKAHEAGLVADGVKVGDFMVKGMQESIEGAAEGIASGFMRALTNSLDGRYIRQPKLFGVSQ
jgi:hypothetical protein